jgi:hypothetical protein
MEGQLRGAKMQGVMAGEMACETAPRPSSPALSSLPANAKKAFTLASSRQSPSRVRLHSIVPSIADEMYRQLEARGCTSVSYLKILSPTENSRAMYMYLSMYLMDGGTVSGYERCSNFSIHLRLPLISR